MSSSFLATDLTNGHDCYLELLAVTNVPTSAYGGRPNMFAVVYLERSLSAPQTVKKMVFGDDTNGTSGGVVVTADHHPSNGLTRTETDPTALSYGKFTVGSVNAATNHPASGANGLPPAQLMMPSALDFGNRSSAAFASAASTGVGGALRVARTNIISNANVSANFETKFCISNCHDREVIRITLYDQVESARGFLGTAIFPVGGPLREYGSRTLELEGPTNMTVTVSWEVCKTHSPSGQQAASCFDDAMNRLYANGSSAVVGALKQRMEEEWAVRYNNSIATVSALQAKDMPFAGNAATASAEGISAAPANTAASVPSAAPASAEGASLPYSAAIVATAEGFTADAATSTTTNGATPANTTANISAREAHLETKVRELEAALLNVAKNRDEMVQRELLRRVAVGEAAPTVPTNMGGVGVNVADATTGQHNLMALSVKDLTLVASQGLGTLSHALAQTAARQQLELMGADGLASSTIAALNAAKQRNRQASEQYINKDLMKVVDASSPAKITPTTDAVGGLSPARAAGTTAIYPTSPLANATGTPARLIGGEQMCPNLVDLINHPCRTLSAEEDALTKAYIGCHTLYQSDKTAYAASVNSALFGSAINFPSLAPHHGHALEAAYILGTDAITAPMQQGLPPLLGSAACPTAMPLSYAKSNMRFKGTPAMMAQIAACERGYAGGLGAAGSLGTPANQSPAANTPLSPAKRFAAAVQQPNLTGFTANNTVLNDIAIASMYPTSSPITPGDPLFKDNTAAWQRALAQRELYTAAEGAKIASP